MTKELDRRFRHVGRIKRSWGTSHKPTIRAMEQMMDGLFQRGRFDILRSLQDKTYTPLEVYDAWRVNELERLPTAATLAPLKESMEKWIAKKECSNSHRSSLHQSLRHLLNSQTKLSLTVGHLPSLLLSLRDSLQGKHPRSFNLARAAAQAFAKTTAGRNSKLWQDITAVEVLKVKPQRRKNPLTYEEVMRLAARTNNYSDAAAIWTMAMTGMGPTEIEGEWEVRYDRIAIHGTKRKGRDRFVPKVLDSASYGRLRGSYKAFRETLRKASDGQVRPYDLRRTFANFMESVGIPRTRRRLYMGHGVKDVTDSYEWQEIERFLAEDADRLRRLMSATERQRLRLVKA